MILTTFDPVQKCCLVSAVANSDYFVLFQDLSTCIRGDASLLLRITNRLQGLFAFSLRKVCMLSLSVFIVYFNYEMHEMFEADNKKRRSFFMTVKVFKQTSNDLSNLCWNAFFCKAL